MIDRLPLDLPLELNEIIFDKLEVRDLLNCMLVCKAWLKFIEVAKSSKKIVLRTDENSNLHEIFESKRKYRNLSLKKLCPGKVVEVLSKFKKFVVKVDVIDCRQDHLRELIDDDFEENITEPLLPVQLPEMRELTVSNSSIETLGIFVKTHKNLKILNLHKIPSPNTIISILSLNSHLTTLNIYLDCASNIFRQEIPDIFNLKLKNLTISYPSCFEIDDRTLANVEKFLKSQGKTLKTIGLINAANISSIYRVWSCLLVVERIEFFSGDPFNNFGFEKSNLELKKSLKFLEIHILGPVDVNVEDVKGILAASKNLTSLGVWNLDLNLLEFSTKNLPNLKNISCANFTKEVFRLSSSLDIQIGNRVLKISSCL